MCERLWNFIWKSLKNILKYLFWCGLFFKSLLSLLHYCVCFMLGFYGPEACGILATQPGIEGTAPAVEGEVLTPESPGKSLRFFFFNYFSYRVFGLSFKNYPFHRSHLFFSILGHLGFAGMMSGINQRPDTRI